MNMPSVKIVYKKATVKLTDLNLKVTKSFQYDCPYCKQRFEADESIIDGDYYSCPHCKELLKIGGWLV